MGTVTDLSSGALLQNARIMLISQTMGTGTTYTNGKGEFTGLVPIGQNLILQVWLPCGPLGAYELVHEETVGPFQAYSEITVQVAVPSPSLVMGNVLDCVGVPVEQGYVRANGQVVFCVEGGYGYMTCAASVSLRAVDLLADNVSEVLVLEVTSDTTQVPDIITCIPLYGTVTDIDDNEYLTVLIETQEWMAANLRTTHYRDGSDIPEVTEDAAWTLLTSEAWCNYENNPETDPALGRIYNGYAATNPNLCPEGWHVPTDADWQLLELALGMLPGDLENSGGRGALQNVGGKLKATTHWDPPNMGATNESGFTALPGLSRYYSNGSFGTLGNAGYWWSRAEFGGEGAWNRLLSTDFAGILRNSSYIRNGFCVRCLRD
jgi:uncharacterized protein (TIGR02145 family)